MSAVRWRRGSWAGAVRVRCAHAVVCAVVLSSGLFAQDAGVQSWLDGPLAGWNRAGAAVPRAPAAGESREALARRCTLTIPQSTRAERAIAEAGWIAAPHFDRQLAQGDVEILDGLISAGPECRPASFQSFVFVGGRFAGTLSPEPMATEHDGVAGPLRILPGDIITADFSRYRPEDAGCCPSAHFVVRFKVDRSGSAPTVVPVEVRKTR